MTEPLDNLYFNWLYSKVCDPQSSSPNEKYEKLLGEMHRTEYAWLLSGDDNRAEDGVELRTEFLKETRFEPEPYWLDETCSVLEMMIAFSRRAAFETDADSRTWFWIMVSNLGLSEMSDANGIDRLRIQGVLDTFIWREYERNGQGGLFPVSKSRNDQRKVEVLYQFSEYVDERHLV